MNPRNEIPGPVSAASIGVGPSRDQRDRSSLAGCRIARAPDCVPTKAAQCSRRGGRAERDVRATPASGGEDDC